MLGMEAKVIFNKARDEIVTVVIAFLHTKLQRIASFFGCLQEVAGFELFVQKLVTVTLVNQHRQVFLRLFD